MRNLALSLLAVMAVSTPATAQVRYRDAEGVTHFVNSKDEVPEQYRAGAVGGPIPAPVRKPSDIDWEAKAREADERAQRAGGGSEPPAPTSAQCRARMRAFLDSQPPGARGTKYDVARAIGPGCDVDAILQEDAKKMELVQGALDECTRRMRAHGDPDKLYDLKDPRAKRELWLDIARAAGNECADLMVR